MSSALQACPPALQACPLPSKHIPCQGNDTPFVLQLFASQNSWFEDESLPNGARVHLWHNRSFLAHLLSFQLVGQKGTCLHHLLTLVGKENLKCRMSHLHSINFCLCYLFTFKIWLLFYMWPSAMELITRTLLWKSERLNINQKNSSKTNILNVFSFIFGSNLSLPLLAPSLPSYYCCAAVPDTWWMQ